MLHLHKLYPLNCSRPKRFSYGCFFVPISLEPPTSPTQALTTRMTRAEPNTYLPIKEEKGKEKKVQSTP